MAGSVAFLSWSFFFLKLGSKSFDRQKKICTIISFLNRF